VRELKLKKPKTLEELAPLERKVCQVLSSLGAVFNTSQLIRHEFSAYGLKGYIGSSLLFPHFTVFFCYYLFFHACVCIDPPAPELPAILQYTLQGFQRGATTEVTEDVARERLRLGFGELLA